jgi:hypothetical protein
MNYRVDVHRYSPPEFSVVRLNSKGLEMAVIAYRPTLKAAVADAEFWAYGGNVIVTERAREADHV